MNEECQIEIQLNPGASSPTYGTVGSAGADVRAHLSSEVHLQPGESALIPTGIFMAIPDGYEIQVRPRSGLALKHSVTVLNTPGTIDSDYRGEVKVILINHGKSSFVVEPNMRVAQLVLAKVAKAEFIKTDELAITTRGSGGFGHTGTQ
ncbi:MAG: dUTP diphosphatase [Waddliaceae bacterium]